MMKTELIRIDWNKAMSECDLAFLKECNKKNKARDNLDMHLAMLSCKIKQMYSKDDVNGYLDLLEDNRTLLKG